MFILLINNNSTFCLIKNNVLCLYFLFYSVIFLYPSYECTSADADDSETKLLLLINYCVCKKFHNYYEGFN